MVFKQANVILTITLLTFGHIGLGSAWAEELRPVEGAGEVTPLPELQVEDLTVSVDESEEDAEKVVPVIVNHDTLGVLNSTNGGVRKNYWSTRNYSEIVTILKRLNLTTISPAYNTFLERLILSSTDMPMPEKEEDWGKAIDVRIKKLIESGRFKKAQYLIAKLPTPYRTDVYGKEIVKMGLVDFNNALVCETLYGLGREQKKLDFWRVTDVVCAVIAGEKSGVNYKLSELKKDGVALPRGLESLILHATKNKEIPDTETIAINPWSLNLMRLLAYGITVPDVLDNIYTKKGLLLNTAVDAYERVVLAEKMFKTGAVDVKTLHDVYNSAPKSYIFDSGTKEPAVKMESKNIPFSFVRMKAYQYMLEKTNLRDRLMRLREVYDVAPSYRDKIETLYIYASMFKSFEPVKGWEGVRVARMFYAVGDYDTAQKWAEKNEKALWFEMALAERLSRSKDAIVFKQDGGLFSDIDKMELSSQETAKKQRFFGILFGSDQSENQDETPAMEGDAYVNEYPLAENGKKRYTWMQGLVAKYGQDKVSFGAMRMTQAFLILESLGYTIEDGVWVFVAQRSALVEKVYVSPSKIKALDIFVKKAIDPIQILLAVKPFVEEADISDFEFSKIINVLYRAGYIKLAQRLAFERIVFYDW